MNVGPTSEGLIPKESVDILKQVGDWMAINHEAIYGTKASPFTAEFPWGNITRKPGKLYLGINNWPAGDFYIESLKNKVKKIYLLSDKSKKAISFKETYDKNLDHHRLKINLPSKAPDKVVSVIVVEINGDAQVEQMITQQFNGTISLPGAVADIRKGDTLAKLNFVSHGGGAEGWSDPSITLKWEFKIEKPGTYDVDIITTETGNHENPSWQGDHIIKIISGEQSFEAKIKQDSKEYNLRSQYWQKIHTQAGKLKFSKPGIYQLQLVPMKFAEGRSGFTFREIILSPA